MRTMLGVKLSSYVTISSSSKVELWVPLLIFVMVNILLIRCLISGVGEGGVEGTVV